MLLSRQVILRMGVAIFSGAALVLACGPFFGTEVLRNRQQVLLAPPTVSFEAELKTLVPPPTDKLPVVDFQPLARGALEARELAPPVLAIVSVMSKQPGGDAAYASGAGLPPAIRLYTAGAVSFLHNDAASARKYFEAILALPENQRNNRDLWARFMLGRIAEQNGNQVAATPEFEQTRALVRSGAPDAMGLAVASFGEQARGAWRAGDVAGAVQLYARQASYGSESAANSLVSIAVLILDDTRLLDRGIDDPTTRRLLFICLNGNAGRRFFLGPATDVPARTSSVDRVVAALDRHHITVVAGAGLLASAAYSVGRFDLAQKLSVLEQVPIAAWVSAKLALRRGDRQAALKFYKSALQGFARATPSATSAGTELAVLDVSRSDYIEALTLFRTAVANGPPLDRSWWIPGFSDYWGDVAYLSERVLTLDELQNYLARDVPAAASSFAHNNGIVQSRLRSILARRLMRAGRRREAIGYFDDANLRHSAEAYADALDKANSWWRLPRTKAQAWFIAATLARQRGLELLGFEREPDFAMWNGNFTPFDYSEEGQEGGRAQKLKSHDPYRSSEERGRVDASKPPIDVRFQYRVTAVEHAMNAADHLPPSSQPFAAVLCQANGWVLDRQPTLAAQIYRRYLKQGAYVPWGRTFGRMCPSPDFAEISFRHTVSRDAQHLVRHLVAHRMFSAVSALLLAAALATMLRWASSRRRPQRL